MIKISSDKRGSFQFDIFDQFLEIFMFLPLLIVGDSQQTEIMGHDEIPFLEFIEHLQFLDL
jgi:hypothetical protein